MKIYSSVVCLHNTKAELLYLGWSYYTENFQPPLPRFHLNRVGSQLTGPARFSYDSKLVVESHQTESASLVWLRFSIS